MRTTTARALTVAIAIATPHIAAATAMTVLGSTDAHQCFLSAATRSTAVASLDNCREALSAGDLPPKDHAATLVNMGIILNSLSRVDEAMSAFDKALALSPKLPEAVLSRGGLLLFLNGKWKRKRPLSTSVVGSKCNTFDLRLLD